MRVLIALLALAAGVQLRESSKANPIRRIVNILQKMQTDLKAEAEKDAELHSNFMCYCKTGASALSKEIDDQSAASKDSASEHQQKSARADQLNVQIAQHKKDRSDAQANIEKATTIRNKEKAEFDKASGDLGKNVAALAKAIAALERGMGKAFLQSRQSTQMLQRLVAESLSVTETEKQTVLGFLSSPYGDYQAAGGEIVGILKQMKDEMEKDLGTTMSDEKAAIANFEELKAAKQAEIAAATKAIEEKSVRSGQLAVEATEAKNAAANAAAEADSNREFMANLGESCKTKTAEFEARTKERSQEMLAISEAIKILNDDDALELFKKTLPTPAAFPQTEILLQTDQTVEAREIKARAQVEALAQVSPNPTRLSLLAYMLRVGKVDFSKVLKMIDEMIAHLGQEQSDDDAHLNMCNTEFDAAADAKRSQERDIKDQSAAIDEAEARMAALKEEIATTEADMAATTKAAEEATTQRQQENKEFKATMVEFNAARQLLDKAKNRLNKFYNPDQYVPPPPQEMTEEERIAQNMGETITKEAKLIAGTNIAVYDRSFVQKLDIGDAPETGTYQKQSSKSAGVLQLMDMLIKDVDAQQQSAEHDESVAQRDYEQLMADSKKSLQDSQASIVQKEGEHADTKARHHAESEARADSSKELAATNEKIAALHGSCDFLLQNFDFRKAARTREIEGLKNAKAVLSGADYS